MTALPEMTPVTQLSRRETAARTETIFDACRRSNLDRIREYVSRGGRLTDGDELGMTLLHHAAFAVPSPAATEIMQLLLAAPTADIEAVDCQKWTPLHAAAARCHTDAVKALLAKGASTSARDEYRRTPLHLAACSDAARTRPTEGASGPTGCEVAVEVIAMLVEEGGNLKAKNITDMTPKQVAEANSVQPEVIAAL
jgi:ankyrin repeat protein